jgi:hypothetical protein
MLLDCDQYFSQDGVTYSTVLLDWHEVVEQTLLREAVCIIYTAHLIPGSRIAGVLR